MKRIFVFLVLAGLVCGLQASIIDDFTDSSISGINTGSTTAPVVDSGLSGVLGGTRSTEFFTTGIVYDLGDGVYYCPSNVGFLPTYLDGAVTINNGSGVYSALTLSYSGFSIDLTTGTKLSLDFDPDHLAYGSKHAVISFTVGDGTNLATVTKDTWDASYLPGGANYNPDRFELDFALSGFTGVDLTNITDISVYIETDDSGDYAIFGVNTDAVPEPATIAILGIGGVLLIRRKRQAVKFI